MEFVKDFYTNFRDPDKYLYIKICLIVSFFILLNIFAILKITRNYPTRERNYPTRERNYPTRERNYPTRERNMKQFYRKIKTERDNTRKEVNFEKRKLPVKKVSDFLR